MRGALLVPALLTTFVLPVRAQDPHPTSTVSVVAAAGRTWDDEGGLGAGAAAGVRADRRLVGGTRIEIALDLLSHDRDAGYFRANGSTTFASAAIVQRFGRGRAQPYLLGGGFIGRHRGTLAFSDQIERDERSTNPGLVLGAGLLFRAGRRFELGPELRAYSFQPDDDLNPAMAHWAGVRGAVRF